MLVPYTHTHTHTHTYTHTHPLSLLSLSLSTSYSFMPWFNCCLIHQTIPHPTFPTLLYLYFWGLTCIILGIPVIVHLHFCLWGHHVSYCAKFPYAFGARKVLQSRPKTQSLWTYSLICQNESNINLPCTVYSEG